MLAEYLKELSKVQKLSDQEERELWMRYKHSGDSDSRRRLIECYQPLVVGTVYETGPREDNAMDLIQEGTVGLIEAVESFEPERGVAFATYARRRIKGRILDYFRSLEEELVHAGFSLEASAGLLGGRIPEESDPALEAERVYLAGRLRNAMKRLPSKEQAVVNAVYIEDQPPRAVAEQMRISQSHLYRLQKQAIRRMRGILSRFVAEFRTV